MPRTAKKPAFETQLKELEGIVARLEDGSLPLEESLELFERGITLSRELQTTLQAASLRVTRLLEGDPPRELPFAEGENPGLPSTCEPGDPA